VSDRYADRLAARMAGQKGADDPTWIPMHVDPREQRMRGIATHGRTPFDVPFVSHIIDNLWQGGCQDGLVLPKNIEHLISLYPWEAYTVTHELKSSLTVRMHDATDQSFAQVGDIAQWVRTCMIDGPTLVHCQAGLNRSSLVAATALTLDGLFDGPRAIALLRERRSPACLCNPAFEQWVAAL
jgi:protein-tyrosine phosphatase